VPVHVERDGDPARPDQRLQEAEVAHRILFGRKDGSGEQRPARIIERADQAAVGPPRLEPGMGAPIPEDEEPRLRSPGAPGAVAGWPSPPGAGNPGRAEQPLDGHPTDGEARLRVELLREMCGVQPRIPALR
jgi:hypothetical protein